MSMHEDTCLGYHVLHSHRSTLEAILLRLVAMCWVDEGKYIAAPRALTIIISVSNEVVGVVRPA